jgi:hypothetical protein
MPQLTAQCERVVISGLLNSDDKKYDFLQVVKLLLMIQEIRISEDYCSSETMVIDLANLNLGHLSKLSVINLKNYELYALVSSLVIRNMFNIP